MQGYNRYIPPHYDGRRSLNSLAGKSHGLGNRGRKASQGILIVRFEAPFDIICEKCSVSMAQGVRFNAEKKKVGFYYSTPLWSFKVKCKECANQIDIRTDPQNARYLIESGAKERSSSRYSEAKDGEEAELGNNKGGIQRGDKNGDSRNSSHSNKASGDLFATLETNKHKKDLRLNREREIEVLYALNTRRWRDSYAVSRRLRDKFRREKYSLEQKERESDLLKNKMSLGLALQEETTDDIQEAQAQTYGISSIFVENKEEKRGSVMTSHLFNKSSVFSSNLLTVGLSAVGSSTSTSNSKHAQRLAARSKYKDDALRNIATRVDMKSDPFFVSANPFTSNLSLLKPSRLKYRGATSKSKSVEAEGVSTPNLQNSHYLSLVSYSSDSD